MPSALRVWAAFVAAALAAFARRVSAAFAAASFFLRVSAAFSAGVGVVVDSAIWILLGETKDISSKS